MKHKKTILLLVLLGVLLWPLFTRCGANPSAGVERKDIPYFEAVNYFYIGGKEPIPDSKICTDAQFDSLFDTASHLDETNHPTPINFSQQFVIAIVLPPTNRRQSVRLRHLTEQGNRLTLTYKLVNGPICSQKVRPMALALVDRRYASKQIEIRRE